MNNTGSNLLWYSREAANWNESLPLGNGRIGAIDTEELKQEIFIMKIPGLMTPISKPVNWLIPANTVRPSKRWKTSLSLFGLSPIWRWGISMCICIIPALYRITAAHFPSPMQSLAFPTGPAKCTITEKALFLSRIRFWSIKSAPTIPKAFSAI